jgi:streptogramin lyase
LFNLATQSHSSPLKNLTHIILLFSLQSGLAQRLPVREYTIRDGLAQMQVVSVLEDSRGYIWCATKQGLSKFDGERFENFYLKDSLHSYYISNLTEDSKGNVWFMYNKKGYGRFDGREIKNYIPGGISNYSNIVEYKKEMHFFRNDSLFKISVDTALFTGQKAPDKYINIVQTEPQSGLLYVYGGGGNLYYLNEATGRFVKVNGLGQSISLQRFEKNLLLTDLFNNAVYLIQGKTLLKCIEKHKSVYDPGFSFVYLDAKTAVWAFKTGDTIATNTGFASPNLNLHFQKPSKQGLYFGTEQGLITLFINGFRYFTKDEVPQAWGVTEDKTGHIWISNYAYPLQRYNGQTLEAVRGYGPPMVQKLKKMNVAIEDEAQTNGWYFNPVRDKHGKLWFPNGQGLMVHDRGKYDLVLKDKEYRLSFYTAYDSIRDKIISCGQGRADIIDTQPPYRISSVTDSTSPMFQNSRLIFSAVVDTSGDYWLSGRGIAKYNPDKKTFTHYNIDNGKLPAKGSVRLYIDSYGGLWASTFSEGLHKYNPSKDRFEPVFEKYFKDKGTSFSGQMTEQYFLVSDDVNIFVIDLEALYSQAQEKVVKVLNHHNGFPGMEPGQNGFFKDSKGKIWITSSTVLSVLDPSALNFKTAPLHTYIRSINGERLPFNYESGTAIELTEGLNDVKIEVESVGEVKVLLLNLVTAYRVLGRSGLTGKRNRPFILLISRPEPIK